MSTFLLPVAVLDCSGRLLSRARGAAAAFLALLISLLLATSAVHAQSSEEAPKGGLFFKSDKAGVLYEAPILRTDVKLAVAGTIVRATVRQHFVNPSSAWLEGVYVFPLPEQSAVDHLVMEIGERRVVGQIKPREEAKKVYEQAAAAGQHASLVESERPNIFTTSVANIGPGEKIVVEIQYQDRVSIDAGTYSLRFPMVVGPRYIPGDAINLVADRSNGGGWADDTTRVPDASRITPPVLHPREGKINPVTMSIDFAPGFPVERVTSLYHPVVATDANGSKVITLAEGDVPADRDFVLEWIPKPSAAPAASLFAEQRGDDVYLFAMLTPATAEQAETPRLPRDVVFVIDTSGSMGGTSIDQAKAGLLLALDRLTPADRFNVIQFNSITDSLYGELKPWTGETLREARAYVDRLKATGGTEMRPALQLALDGETSPGRLKQVIFLTDAAVGNEAELFDDIARRLGDARLFTIGIGTAPNSYFMRKAAELGRGSFTYIGDVTEVGERMTELLRKLEQPAITDIAVRWPDGLPASAEMYPATVPDIYVGVPVTFTARLPGTKLDQLSGLLAIEGEDGDAAWRHGIDIGQARSGAGVAAVWARAKLSAIEDGQWHGADPARVREAATAHALAYELVSSYTSLVAVDEEVVRPHNETLTSAQVPTNLPHGWVYEKVFGPGSDGGTNLPQPGQLMRKINFTGTPLDGLALPKTATPAMVHLLIGLLLTVAALTIHLLYRRRRTQGPATDALSMAARRIA
ncbi:MAG: marine proteobacterial sortase target protein [Rhodospirillum sp.]|nr:marine proteobacterial sortase target protein [Rhodospirillum sp.]